ncbi:transcriptional coactivator PipX [Cyanobacterium sp. uoEpiScrs1]|uniref:transcriptional coactivator PipX n=1 Tax=Cyanobacterium sp. uoEpiScrs1 TaxID=2976343 RepID=UPI002269D03C|nr:PipX family protein [Cyanobacterium sp. uoEpiScrs1]
MSNETYFNHPTFGLLYRVCSLDNNEELFTTLYAQRLFFLLKILPTNMLFEPVSRSGARLLVETRVRDLRRLGALQDYQELQTIYERTFP